MESAPTKLATKNPVELLSAHEREAYEKHLRSGRAPLGPDLSARLFQSFLNGRTCSDIQNDNEELSYGAIVDARVRDNWDEQRANYMHKLLERAGNRAMRAQLEAVEFVFEMFQITHMVSRKKFEEYRRTGDIKVLEGALQVESVKQYRDLIAALVMLAGRGEGGEGGMSLPHPTAAAVTTTQSIPSGERPVASLEGADFLTQAAASRREEQARQQVEHKALEDKKSARKPAPLKKDDEED